MAHLFLWDSEKPWQTDCECHNQMVFFSWFRHWGENTLAIPGPWPLHPARYGINATHVANLSRSENWDEKNPVICQSLGSEGGWVQPTNPIYYLHSQRFFVRFEPLQVGITKPKSQPEPQRQFVINSQELAILQTNLSHLSFHNKRQERKKPPSEHYGSKWSHPKKSMVKLVKSSKKTTRLSWSIGAPILSHSWFLAQYTML